jgi:hypothetical protein
VALPFRANQKANPKSGEEAPNQSIKLEHLNQIANGPESTVDKPDDGKYGSDRESSGNRFYIALRGGGQGRKRANGCVHRRHQRRRR